jgi:membrane-associated phospholipid phosphatase
MRASETIAVVYFSYLAISAAFVRLGWSRRLIVWSAAAAVVAAEYVIVGVPASPAVERIRDWLPALVILLGYYAAGIFFVAPSARAEAWLARSDRWLRDGWIDRLPAPVRNYFELVYDSCFLMIPAGYAVLDWSGRAALADEYWTLVSAAEFLCFATLPWFQARPPWAIEPRRPADWTAVRRFSLTWVDRTTIHATTFPSGHTAASLAVALAVWAAVPWAGAVFLLLAVSIAAASVAGRFHYTIDAIAGILLAMVLAGVSTL